MEELPNQVIFRRIGSVSPVLNYVHLRTTAHLSTLDAMAEQICEYPEIMTRIAHFDQHTGLHDTKPYVIRGPVPGSNGT